jgi:signal transduction histidine kinase
VPVVAFLAFVVFDIRQSQASFADAAGELAMPFLVAAQFIAFNTNWTLRPRRTTTRILPIDVADQWGRRNRPSEDPGADALVQPVLVGIGAACFGLACGLVVISLFGATPSTQHSLRAYWSSGILGSMWLIQATLATTTSSRGLYAWGQERAAAAANAQADVDRARMAALQAQMNPHFLFNALNTVAALLGTDGSRARDTVRNLSGMLKHTLDRSAEPLTTVRDELQFVRDYLAIERERFGSRLDVVYDLDPAVDDLPVPTMSLQPLVENAIKHAVTTRIEGGRIHISVSKPSEERLRLSVEDDGPGFAADAKDGMGLSNVRQRLRTLYGDAAALDVATSSSGSRVTMTIPLET